jgi:hypothetical protein
MEFRSGFGREVISVAQVTAVDIKIFPTAGPDAEPGIEASFSGPAAVAVVAQLRLNEPSTEGLPATLQTGTITIQYATPGGPSVRELSIQDAALLEDPLYTYVTYPQAFPLDRAWVERLK